LASDLKLIYTTGTNALTKLNKAGIQIIKKKKKKSNKVYSTFTFHGNNNYSIHMRYEIYDLSLREKRRCFVFKMDSFYNLEKG